MRKKKEKLEAKNASSAALNDYPVLISPIVTEKSSMVGAAGNVVVFKVAKTATKTDIKRAVESIFNVKVDRVSTTNILGKVMRSRGTEGRRPGLKKAYITLKEGQKLNVVEGL